MGADQRHRTTRPRFSSCTSLLLRSAELMIALSLVYALVPIVLFRLEVVGAVYFALILAGFAFASLLYNRSRAYSAGRARFRSLVAAEFAMHGVLRLLLAAVLGASLYAVFLGLGFQRLDRLEDITRKHLWFLLFLVPLFVTIPGVVGLRRAIEMAAVDFPGYSLSTRRIIRRVRDGGIRDGRERAP